MCGGAREEESAAAQSLETFREEKGFDLWQTTILAIRFGEPGAMPKARIRKGGDLWEEKPPLKFTKPSGRR